MQSDYTNKAWIRKIRTTLKATSYDSKNEEYMTDSSLSVVDFDKFKEEYLRERGKPITMAYSADALSMDGEYSYLIEFKNGEIDPIQIRDKLKDSVMMLCDEWKKTTTDTRKEIRFVLVYNESQKALSKSQAIAIAKANTTGNPQPKIWGLEKANIYVNRALIYNREQFSNKLLPSLKGI